MTDQEIKEVVEVLKREHDSIMFAERYLGIKKALGVVIDLAQHYLSAGEMVEEKKGLFVVEAQDGGHWVMTEYADGFNSARSQCLMLLVKKEEEIEELKETFSKYGGLEIVKTMREYDNKIKELQSQLSQMKEAASVDKIRDKIIYTMNNEAVRNGNPEGHKYNLVCSCGRCHMSSLIAQAIHRGITDEK